MDLRERKTSRNAYPAPDYHLPGDEAAKINWNKTVDITKASFLAMWKLANEKKY